MISHEAGQDEQPRESCDAAATETPAKTGEEALLCASSDADDSNDDEESESESEPEDGAAAAEIVEEDDDAEIRVGDLVRVSMRSKVYNGRKGIVTRILTKHFWIDLTTEPERKFLRAQCIKEVVAKSGASSSSAGGAAGAGNRGPAPAQLAKSNMEKIFGKVGC